MLGSIRGRGIDTVIVQPRKVVRRNGTTTYVPAGEPFKVENVDVQGVREWSTSEESYSHGITYLTLYRVYSRVPLGDENALIYYNGRVLEVVGAPQPRLRTRRTAHWQATLRDLGAAAPPVVKGGG